MNKTLLRVTAILFLAALLSLAIAAPFLSFRRPFRACVEESGVAPSLAYAVMKAESGFSEHAVSEDGAVGLMQLMPTTAEFIARKTGVPFAPDRLFEGGYNATLGCAYLKYLLNKFRLREAIAAYNAGEGAVSRWLTQEEYSSDGVTLSKIPYIETQNYVKKVEKFQKTYQKLYGYS